MAELADVNALIGGAGGERVVALPVDVERGRRMIIKLLDLRSFRRIPYNRRLQTYYYFIIVVRKKYRKISF